MHRIAGLVADVDRHDLLLVNIDHRLAVVTLDPAVCAFQDVAVGISEVPLVVGCQPDRWGVRAAASPGEQSLQRTW